MARRAAAAPVIAIPAVLTTAIQQQGAAIQALLAAIPAPAPAPVVPLENQLLVALKAEIVPAHLHPHFPTTCSWRQKIHLLEPGFWLAVAINMPQPLTRLDMVKSLDLPGDFVMSFTEALYKHFPNIEQTRKNVLVECFEGIMNLYILHIPAVNALLAAVPLNVAAIRAVADQLVLSAKSLFTRSREITIQLDAEIVAQTHGPQSAAIYSAMTKELNGEAHLGDSHALKQITYHSIHGRRGQRANVDGTDPAVALSAKASKCRRCQQSVPFGGFKSHNKICPGKGAKKGGKDSAPLKK